MSLKAFDIELSKLRQGTNHYEFRLGTAFFESFGNEWIKGADLLVKLELEKSETLVNLRFETEGLLSLECEKCLSSYGQPMKSRSALVVKITEEAQPADEEDEIIYLNRRDNNFSVAQHLYEDIILAMPFVKSCASPGNEPQCDMDVLSRLASFGSGHPQEEENQGSDKTDDRWDKLKDLFK